MSIRLYLALNEKRRLKKIKLYHTIVGTRQAEEVERFILLLRFVAVEK